MVSRKKPRDRKPSLKKPGLDPEHALVFFGSYGSRLGHTKHIFIPVFFFFFWESHLYPGCSVKKLGGIFYSGKWSRTSLQSPTTTQPIVVHPHRHGGYNQTLLTTVAVYLSSSSSQAVVCRGNRSSRSSPPPKAVVCKFTSLVVGANQLHARGWPMQDVSGGIDGAHCVHVLPSISIAYSLIFNLNTRHLVTKFNLVSTY